MVWHRDSELPDGIDFIGVPGGFSYGDYLRSGAMAARSPIMRAVTDAAARGVPVIGICNGFQVLTEAGLLPGALMIAVLAAAVAAAVCGTFSSRAAETESSGLDVVKGDEDFHLVWCTGPWSVTVPYGMFRRKISPSSSADRR